MPSPAKSSRPIILPPASCSPPSPRATPKDIDLAVAAARRAFEGSWSKVKPYERQALLLKFADLVEKHFDELALLDTLDMGAPVMRTFAGKQRILGMLRFYAGQATLIYGETIENSLPGEIFSYTLKEPVGVVGAIIPWNSPLSASIWKIGPAIATGCTIVLKPAEEAPLTSLRLGELALEAGFPAGVINVVPGYGETAGAALASHHRRQQGRFHRLALHRTVDHPCLGRQSQARIARARWQVAEHRVR
jgi:aldehyde dehydrogenase (NAD+)